MPSEATCEDSELSVGVADLGLAGFMGSACLECTEWEMEAFTGTITLSQQWDEFVNIQSLYGLQGRGSHFG